MGSPAASRGNTHLLLLLLMAGLHLSGAQTPVPAPSPTPAPVTVAPPILPAPAADALPPPPAAVADVFSFSFDFTDKSNYRQDDLKFEGDASAHPNQVDLTCNTAGCGLVGRMSYGHPVPLYDSTTGEVASFQTSFTFSITTDNYTARGDGMAFFLAYFNSTMPSPSLGGCLGLTSQDGNGNCLTALDTDQFLAVEFDTFHNTWDPNSDTAYDHIGIDINSMISLDYTTSLTSFNMSDCSSMTATITFNSTTQILVADLSDDAGRYLPVQMSTKLLEPLNTLFPAQVAVGISGATGSANDTEGHVIQSWSFNSSLALPHKGIITLIHSYLLIGKTNAHMCGRLHIAHTPPSPLICHV